MLYSGACEHAIRALTYLAQQNAAAFVRLRDVASAEDIPYPFLAKIFQQLVRAGLLRSARGRKGGYALAEPASHIALYDIKEAIDGTEDLEECASGLDRCSDEMPCPLHDTFKPLRERIKAYLKATSLEDMARAVTRKRASLRARAVKLAARPRLETTRG